MQKKLIVLAIAALASTSAFADTTVYGVLDGAVASVSGTGKTGGTLALSGGLAASRLGVKATEALDNGVTAVAIAEYGVDGETSTGLAGAASRQELLGLAGSFGTVATGYLQTTGYDWGGKYNPFAGSAASALDNVTNKTVSPFYIGTQAGANRAQRALAYISPDFNGLNFAVNYSTALAGTGDVLNANTLVNTNITATLASVNYTAGALSVGAVYAGLGGNSNASEVALGASYDLTVAKLFATYQSEATSTVGGATSTTNTAYSVSAVVPAAADAVALSYAANSINSNSANSATSYSVAYLHPMSKTTTAYAAYAGVTNGSGTGAYGVDNGLVTNAAGVNVGATSSVVAFGLNKKF